MSALAHYVPNYSQYYQYRYDQPYYMFPRERQELINKARIIPEAALDAAPLAGLAALSLYTIGAARAENERLQNKNTQNAKIRERLAEINLHSELPNTIRSIEPPMSEQRDPVIELPPPVYTAEVAEVIDFDVPARRWVVKGGIKADKTLTKNVNQLIKQIEENSLSNVLHRFSHAPGIELFTEKGLKRAAFDPTQYIPKEIYPYISNRVKGFLEAREQMPSLKVAKKNTHQEVADIEYMKDIVNLVKQQNPFAPEEERKKLAFKLFHHYRGT